MTTTGTNPSSASPVLQPGIMSAETIKTIRDSANTLDSVVIEITNALNSVEIPFASAVRVSIQLERLKETAQTLYRHLP